MMAAGGTRGRMIRRTLLLVVVIAVAGALTGAVVNHDDTASTVDGYCVDLPDAIGLYSGNPVTQMGVRVGQVTSITPQGDGVRLTFEVDTNRRFPADSQAVTRSKSLLADRSLELVGNYSAGPTLVPGKCIPRDRSFTPKSISDIAGSTADFVKGLSAPGDSSVAGTLSGLDVALAGTGQTAADMYRKAAAAAQDPDQFTADIGASIMNMAPLNQAALDHWAAISRVLDTMPAALPEVTDLGPIINTFAHGVWWLVATLYDIDHRYGNVLGPMLDVTAPDIIRLLAARAPDLQTLYRTIPTIAQFMNEQQGGNAVRMAVPQPVVTLSAQQCRALALPCTGSAPVVRNLFDLVVQGVNN
ncbi:MlaD family protein [Gordonia polyisoprenivorans]|uniref:MlaD family protein n=1 Tax=Gordonia polyisoprenivorans TaxID=84595 RepID=UPI00054E54CF|nr:MlaD family protein [Gordonia polyisoprenivorans]